MKAMEKGLQKSFAKGKENLLRGSQKRYPLPEAESN